MPWTSLVFDLHKRSAQHCSKKVSWYDDDNSLYHMSSDISHLESAINEDLQLLDNVLKGNELSLNVANMKSMLTCTRSRRKL